MGYIDCGWQRSAESVYKNKYLGGYVGRKRRIPDASGEFDKDKGREYHEQAAQCSPIEILVSLFEF